MYNIFGKIPEGVPPYLTVSEFAKVTGATIDDIELDIKEGILLQERDSETNQLLIPSWQLFPQICPPFSTKPRRFSTDNLDLSIFPNRTEEE